ncbi:hypothetical protein MD484_g1466, partial [Candolleomyces efflorescens]
MSPLEPTYFSGASHFQIDCQIIYTIAGNQYQILNVGEDLIRRLNPILDASHTRNRKKSPPDSECFPGTREAVILEITAWADAPDASCSWDGETSTCSDDSLDSVGSFWTCSEEIASDDTNPRKNPHIYWLHGFVGCGKSAVSLEVAKIYARSKRLLVSYFFLRGAGDRATMNRFAVTLASQLVVALPATAPFIEAAVRSQPGLLTGDTPLTAQLECLVYNPLLAVIERDLVKDALANGPFLIVIDGLDECEDESGVEDFIDQMLDLFQSHPAIPLRVFIASRVDQHIRVRLEVDGVRMANLSSHWPAKDIEKFLRESFCAVRKRDRVIQAYVQAHGEWPTAQDTLMLVEHVKESFVLASTMFNFITQPAAEGDYSTPMERLPLALQMNGLDTLYVQTLIRSQNLPHFCIIISTITLLAQPLPIIGIAELLAIETFEVVRVLLNLQGIIHVPGTNEGGDVTLCHTSLRDFLTIKSRSGSFFVPPSHHLHLAYCCFSSIFQKGHGLAHDYGILFLDQHWRSFAESNDSDFIGNIEQFKARHPLQAHRLSYHPFLCTGFFYSLFWLEEHPTSGDQLLIECAKQLALAFESPDDYTRIWLEKKLFHGAPSCPVQVVQLTEQVHKTIQLEMPRVRTGIRAAFPDFIQRRTQGYSVGPKTERVFLEEFSVFGMDIFDWLEWLVARAQFKLEEAKATMRPPLKITADSRFNGDLNFSLDGTHRQGRPRR